MTLTERLHAAVSAVCPIYGVYIDDPTNKATWGFTPNGATGGQITAGTAAITAFDNSGGAQTIADAQSVLAMYDGLHTQATDIASASTVDLSVATGPYVSITGTTTITAFTSQTAGQVRRLTFAGSLTLTHNATSLICPGNVNILTAAGDRCEVVSLGSGNWQVRNYQAASPPPVPFPLQPQGRLSGNLVALSITDLTPVTDIAYIPFTGNTIPIYDGTSAWTTYTFSSTTIYTTRTGSCTRTNASKVITNISFSTKLLAVGMAIGGTGLAGTIASIDSDTQVTSTTNSTGSGAGGSFVAELPASTNYDIFMVNDGGTPALRYSNPWSSGSARADAISLQNNIYVNTSAVNGSMWNGFAAKTGTYLGTVRTTSTQGTSEDSFAKRFLWNMYNRRMRPMSMTESTASWNYTTATWRQARATATNQLEWVVGLIEDMIELMVYGTASNGTGANASVGIGINSTSANSAQVFGGHVGPSTSGGAAQAVSYRAFPALGYSYGAWLEYSAATGTTTWYGNNGLADIQSGMNGFLMG